MFILPFPLKSDGVRSLRTAENLCGGLCDFVRFKNLRKISVDKFIFIGGAFLVDFRLPVPTYVIDQCLTGILPAGVGRCSRAAPAHECPRSRIVRMNGIRPPSLLYQRAGSDECATGCFRTALSAIQVLRFASAMIRTRFNPITPGFVCKAAPNTAQGHCSQEWPYNRNPFILLMDIFLDGLLSIGARLS